MSFSIENLYDKISSILDQKLNGFLYKRSQASVLIIVGLLFGQIARVGGIGCHESHRMNLVLCVMQFGIEVGTNFILFMKWTSQ